MRTSRIVGLTNKRDINPVFMHKQIIHVTNDNNHKAQYPMGIVSSNT